jgi:hypothetical protein
MDELQDLHARQFADCRDLSGARANASVFALEYVAAKMPVAALERSLHEGGSTHPPRKTLWWSTGHLPLLVDLAGEDCDYDGPGTDFWPGFEEWVGCQLSHDSWRPVVHVFEHGSSILSFARPARKLCSDKFCPMAWSITHAVLLQYLHLTLARSMTQIKATALPKMPAGVVASRMCDKPQRTDHRRRCKTLRKEQRLIAALVWMTLGIAAHEWISPRPISCISPQEGVGSFFNPVLQ